MFLTARLNRNGVKHDREKDRLIVRFFRFSAAVSLITFLILGWGVAVTSRTSTPVMHFSDVQPPLPSARCAECHQEQANSLARAPHANTLQPGNSNEMLGLWSGLKYRDAADDQAGDSFEVRDQILWRKNSAFPDPIPIDWVLGSGRHARTPVTLHTTASGAMELIQHRVSWYPNQVGLDLTLGSSDMTPTAAGWRGWGTRLNPSEAADCLGCHATWLPHSNGRIDLEHLVPGVQCARCHLGGRQHVAAMEGGQAETHIERWSELTPLESIRRCGECHRRDDHFTPRELRPENPLLIRFAPVGLSQSRCFVRQDSIKSPNGDSSQRLDCVTCHNPHRPAETRTEFYVARCLACHGTEMGKATGCTSDRTSDQCLKCHMPQVEVQSHLRFTDHWIRKRQD